jgi:pyruvate/2-oxoglutarate dehydrogenase complex dihydrolipoamide acyltransferase (E2) component
MARASTIGRYHRPMSTPIKLPNLGADTEEARLVAWLKKVGDSVTTGEAIAEIETEKATVDLESPATGTITEILVSADTDVTVGTILANLDEA